MLTNQKGHIIQLDGIRFIAVGLVLIAHWFVNISLPLGELGVTMFFVLSGFLITRILLISKEKFIGQPYGLKRYLTKFFIRRTIRIFPIYYLVLAIALILNVENIRETWLWLFLYGTNIYIAINQHWIGVVDHLWSLAVEEQVYLFFPFLIFFTKKARLITIFWIMGIFSLLLRLYFFYSGKAWFVSYVSMPTCLDSFALGGAMAWIQLNRTKKFDYLFGKSWPVLVGLFVWFLLEYYSKNYQTELHNVANVVFNRLVSSIFCFFLIGRAIVGYTGVMKLFLENPISVYIGKISYGVYLYHNFVYNHYHSGSTHPTVRLFHKIYGIFPTLEGSLAFEVILQASVTIALASLSWHFFEKPINDLKDRYAY